MRSIQKKILLFETLIFAILCINSFVRNILGTYGILVFLLILLVLTRILFGFTKSRQRYTKDIILDVVIFMMIFFILFYLLGIFIGFAKNDNYYTYYAMKTFVFPAVAGIILEEVLRYELIAKVKDSKLMVIATAIVFIVFDITNTIYFQHFNSAYATFMFIAMYFLPAISKSIICTLLSMRVGYKPVILYLFFIELYVYFIPIIPNPDNYLTSVIRLIVPIALWFRLYNFFKFEDEEEEDVSRDYKKNHFIGLLVPAALIIVIVYFTSGQFHYHAVAVASGSMEPKIAKGDVVIIEKIGKNYSLIKEGSVVAYKYSGTVVIHRVVKIIEKDGEKYFYTKGDNNANADTYAVRESMIVGVVNHYVPYIGIPTVWLNEI